MSLTKYCQLDCRTELFDSDSPIYTESATVHTYITRNPLCKNATVAMVVDVSELATPLTKALTQYREP